MGLQANSETIAHSELVGFDQNAVRNEQKRKIGVGAHLISVGEGNSREYRTRVSFVLFIDQHNKLDQLRLEGRPARGSL